MRILNILCGLAVLFTTLAFAHLLHHHFTHTSPGDVQNVAFMAGMAVCVIVGILSLIGGCLLIRRAR